MGTDEPSEGAGPEILLNKWRNQSMGEASHFSQWSSGKPELAHQVLHPESAALIMFSAISTV